MNMSTFPTASQTPANRSVSSGQSAAWSSDSVGRVGSWIARWITALLLAIVYLVTTLVGLVATVVMIGLSVIMGPALLFTVLGLIGLVIHLLSLAA